MYVCMTGLVHVVCWRFAYPWTTVTCVHAHLTYCDTHNPAQPSHWDIDVIYYLVVLVSIEGIVLTDCALGAPHAVDTNQTSSIHKAIVERRSPSGVMYCWAVIKVPKQNDVVMLFNKIQQMVHFIQLLLLRGGIELRTG